jgi:hypothetical protein
VLLTCALGAAAAEPIEKESGMSHARPVKCRERQARLSGERWCHVVTVRGGRLKDFDAKSTFCTAQYYSILYATRYGLQRTVQYCTTTYFKFILNRPSPPEARN